MEVSFVLVSQEPETVGGLLLRATPGSMYVSGGAMGRGVEGVESHPGLCVLPGRSGGRLVGRGGDPGCPGLLGWVHTAPSASVLGRWQKPALFNRLVE